MADGVSALDLVPGHSGVSGAAGVTLTEVRPASLIQFAAWPETLAEVGTLAARATGLDAAPGPGRVATGAGGTLLRVEPLKWWLLGGEGEPPVIEPETGAVLDLSHSRTWLRLGGEQVARLLNHHLPLDLSARACPPGTVATTAFHHVGVTIWREDEGYSLFLPRSVAASLTGILIESSAQYGLQIV